MSDPYLSEIRIFSFNFAPKNWAFCNGQTMSIQQNVALFSLLGTTYGGDGIRTFQLPNLQGNVPISWGNGAGLSPYTLGEVGGVTNVTLTAATVPQHMHNFNATTMVSATALPTGAVFGNNTGGSGIANYSSFATADPLNPATVELAGGNLPHNNLQPFLVLNFCIALSGIFPSRG